MRFAKSLFAFIYIFFTLLYGRAILLYLDLSKMDFGGHIASAAQFLRNGLHGFNDRIFLGATHGLFYPPLEDVFVNVIKLVSFQDFISSFKIYLLLVFILFMFSAYKLGNSFKSLFSLSLFHFLFLVLFNIKKESLFLQGMGAVDLLHTGLTNQFLGGIVFFWTCKEILLPSKRHVPRLIIFTILALLSHIVVGFVTFLIVLTHLLNRLNKKEIFMSLFFILGGASFYLLPMIYYREFMTTNNIFFWEKSWLSLSCAIFLVMINFVLKFRCPFSVVSLVLVFTESILPSSDWLISLFPSFHYYRFTILSYLLIIIGIGKLFDSLVEMKFKKALYVISFFWVLPILHTNSSLTKFFHDEKLQKNENKLIANLPKSIESGRSFLIDSSRPIGTGVESLLSVEFPTFRSTKGLFWESSYTNNISSSYLATLLGLPSVLNYYRSYEDPCSIKKCFMEEYFRTYNVKFLIVDILNTNYLLEEEKQCWNKFLKNGSVNFKFRDEGDLQLNNSQYDIFSIQPQNMKSQIQTSSVELIHADQIKFLNDKPFEVLRLTMMNLKAQCYSSGPMGDSSFFLHRSDEKSFQEFLKLNPNKTTAAQTYPINIKKISENKFEFELSQFPAWFILKIAPQPGMEMIDEVGNKLPIFRSYPHTLSYGQGKISLIFVRTPIMIFGYIITIMTVLSSIVYFFVFKRGKTLTEVLDEPLHSP